MRTRLLPAEGQWYRAMVRAGDRYRSGIRRYRGIHLLRQAYRRRKK